MSSRLQLVLASASPRRQELLALLRLPIICEPAAIDESVLPGESPGCHVLRIARAKAARVARGHPQSPVLAADTIVVVGNTILGKPYDRAAARAMLALLSGRSHSVLTGMCLMWRGNVASHLEPATVTFGKLDAARIDWYLASGEGDDKAGAYAVQGLAGALITRVEGNVHAVIGLPLGPLLLLFEKVGIEAKADGPVLALRQRSCA